MPQVYFGRRFATVTQASQ